MKLLVVGGGAREHALAWALARSPRTELVLVAPGNGGTGNAEANLPVDATDFDGLVAAVREHHIDLTMVGPEVPLALGLVDRFDREGLAVVGPTQAAARIETSKVFAKELMAEAGVPTAPTRIFSAYGEANSYVQHAELPLVVKADGLAAGKGVTVCRTREEALAAVRTCMEERAFGEAGDRILVEECLEGQEVSVFAFCDETDLSGPVAACDYKRALDGDRGPNTGGMGSYSPPPFWSDELAAQVMDRIMRPTVQALASRGAPYRGVLYAGLMLTREGPMVIEFNCRLGDPEAQVVLPRLKTDLPELLQAVAEGEVRRVNIQWSDEACVGVVVASEGYPAGYETGFEVTGLDRMGPDVLCFHGGTRLGVNTGEVGAPVVLTDGGRVLTVVARAETLRAARGRVYTNLRSLSFHGAWYRRDIAAGLEPTVDRRG